MAKRRNHAPRTAPVRLSPADRFEVDQVSRATGWTFAKSLAVLLTAGTATLKGGDTAAKHTRKYFETQRDLHAAEIKAAEKLAPKKAAVRAAAAILKVNGPDVPDASAIGKPNPT
jgi:hypothetical protein